MKILFVNSYFYLFGGAERVMLAEMEKLKELGYEVFIFSVNKKENIESEYLKYFLDEDNIGIKQLNNRQLNLWDKIKYCLTNIYNFRTEKAFDKFLLETKPDIIHIHNYSRYLTPAIWLTAKKHNIPVVTTEHSPKLVCPTGKMQIGGCGYCWGKLCVKGNYLHSLKYKCNAGAFFKTLNNFIELSVNKKKYVKYTDKMIAPSLYLKNLLIESGIPVDKIIYLENFVDLDKFQHSKKQDGYYFYFGRLSSEKGLDTLIRAFKDLPDKNLKIAGSGPDFEKISEFINVNQIKNIELLGNKSGNELINLIQNCTAVILPSEWGENSPLSMLEAFGCGKPVIGAKIGGIPEMIDDGVNGYLFESGNVEELKKCINKTFALGDKILNMGLNARKKAEEKYTLENHISKLINIYKDIINANAERK